MLPYFSPGYCFAISFEEMIMDLNQTSFKEVKGLSSKVNVSEIEEGGNNLFKYKIPESITYDNLVLSRGYMSASSGIAKWINDQMVDNFNKKITPKTIVIHLLNHLLPRTTVMSWMVYNAYPIGWSLNGFDAQQSALLMEEITFAYSHFEIMGLIAS